MNWTLIWWLSIWVVWGNFSLVNEEDFQKSGKNMLKNPRCQPVDVIVRFIKLGSILGNEHSTVKCISSRIELNKSIVLTKAVYARETCLSTEAASKPIDLLQQNCLRWRSPTLSQCAAPSRKCSRKAIKPKVANTSSIRW